MTNSFMTPEEQEHWEKVKALDPTLCENYIGVKITWKKIHGFPIMQTEYIPNFSLLWKSWVKPLTKIELDNFEDI